MEHLRATSWPVHEESERRIVTESRHDQRAVEEPVEPLTRALGDEHAAVARRAFEMALGVVILGRMPRADRIVRTEPPEVPRVLQMSTQPSTLVDTSPPSVPSLPELPVDSSSAAIAPCGSSAGAQ